MSRLKIVWSNQKAQQRKRRWHKLACDVGRRLYVVEELVTRVINPAGRGPSPWKWCVAAALLSEATNSAVQFTAQRAGSGI